MPDSVSDIADGAFAGCQSVYLICESENTAAAYAAGKHIPYRIEKLK